MKKALAILLALTLLLGLAACGGGGASNPAVGTWIGLYTKFVGDDDSARDTSSPFTLELKSNGKGTHHRDDLDINVEWKLDGENVSMTETFMGLKLEYTGTLQDGELHLFNGDPKDIFTVEYVYNRDGKLSGGSSTAASAGSETASPAGRSDQSGSGEGELYDAGNVTVLVPAGWKAFPQSDVFAEEEGAMNPDVIRVCKGGETDWDLFTKPSIQINYWGPSVTGLPTDKDWYEDAKDLEPITTGDHHWTGFQGASMGSKLIVLFEDLGNIQYQATIWYETDDGSISLEDADVQAILASPFPSDGTEATGAGEEPAGGSEIGGSDVGEPVEQDYEWWAGDWYGWWCIKNASGIYTPLSDIAWDAYAQISVFFDDTGLVMLWDSETDMYNALASCWVTFEPGTDAHGRMLSDSGAFFDGGSWLEGPSVTTAPIETGDWEVDAGDSTVSHFRDMIEICGSYQDPNDPANSFDYFVYLRPWGTLWDDVRDGDTSGCLYSDMMPILYDNWYLPLVQQGVTELPESIEAGFGMLQNAG